MHGLSDPFGTDLATELAMFEEGVVHLLLFSREHPLSLLEPASFASGSASELLEDVDLVAHTCANLVARDVIHVADD